ncbi:MAG: response regulator transcription factor [Lewinellaceae bacterium]|nr:response regulator transcription factor [Saprospiraceae bacterium]MCB9353506.1 response regulator transcription factor [Lewinellaceae bacterium]
MRVLIIEDEDLAVWGLISKLQRLEPAVEILATLDTVQTAVAWFRENPAPDLAFFDIQLADGLSFEIFEQVTVPCPIIFTTAYDAYALRAFKVNSVDYLLKPVAQDELSQALSKLRHLRGPAALDAGTLQQMMQMLKPKEFKNRFMVRVGDHLTAIDAADVDFFFGENKIVWLRHANGRKYPVDYTLEQLDGMLDPERFFRVNRQYIASIGVIRDVVAYSNSRLKVNLKDPMNEDPVLISREKVEAFKTWLGK